jgi:hypothetical protein
MEWIRGMEQPAVAVMPHGQTDRDDYIVLWPPGQEQLHVA